jgi:radical SAM enzyme (TIGR01210 family)
MDLVSEYYSQSRAARDRFVVSRRPERRPLDPWRHQGVLLEDERTADGTIVPSATVFLTGRECPWRCVMCDLWQHTTTSDTPRGALVAQLDDALQAMRGLARQPVQIKLYNAGSFFDGRAVPQADDEAIAGRLASFERVVVESHPALIGRRQSRFGEMLMRAAGGGAGPRLEVAMGLETAHPDALERLNKRFTPAQFANAAERLRRTGADLRVFVLVGVPFIPGAEQRSWLAWSIAFAFDCGATAVSLIATRGGNGALAPLAAEGAFDPPALSDLEEGLGAALPSARGRVFADLWDLERLAACRGCFAARRDRLQSMNLQQRVLPPVRCGACGMPGPSV